MPNHSSQPTPPEQPDQPAPPWVVTRMSVMMFLQHAALSLWVVTVGYFILENTGDSGSGVFSPGFVGLAGTTGALAALLSPVVMGVVADRFFSSEKLLALLHCACAVFLVGMCAASSQGSFYLAMLFYYLAFAPTYPLTSSTALRNLPKGEQQFAYVRALGTAGWVAGGLVVGLAWPAATGRNIEPTLVPLQIAAACHLLLGIYCVTLPATPALGRTGVNWRSLAGGASLWKNRSFVILLAVSALATAPSQIYNNFADPFLNKAGFEHAAAKLTLGQVVEIGCLVALPVLWLKFGLKRLFLFGVMAWAFRFVLFAYCQEYGAWLVYPAILVHGACFAFVHMTGQLFADRLADRDARAAAQSFHHLATNGVGNLLGALAGAWAQAHYLDKATSGAGEADWRQFWLVPCAISLVAAVLFAIFFTEKPRPADQETS